MSDNIITNYTNVSKEETLNAIYNLDNKSNGSIKNIVAGLNQMIKSGLIDPNNLSDTFIPPSNFDCLMNKTRHYVKYNNKNPSWPSFLNDIRTAVIQVGTLDLTNMSFAEAFFALGQRKYGRITKCELARIISNNHEKFSFTTTYDWLREIRIPTYTRSIDIIKNELDGIMGANGELGAKVLYPYDIQGLKRRTKNTFVKQTAAFIEDVDNFIAYKVDNILPNIEKPFEKQITDLRLKRELFSDPPNGRTWTKSSDGVFRSEQAKRNQFAYFFNSLVDWDNRELENISLADLLNEEALLIMTEKAKTGEASIFTALEVLSMAKTECEKNSYLSLYYPDVDKYLTYEKWVEHLDILSGEIKKYINELEKIAPDSEGKKNVAFILSRDNETQVAMINDILDKILFLACSYPPTTSQSLQNHATLAMYHIGVFGCPLRCENFSSLKWLGDILEENEYKITNSKNIASIYKINGSYKLFVPKGLLKNRYNKNVEDIAICIDYAKSSIVKYLEIRSIFLSHSNINSEFFLINSSDGNQLKRSYITNNFTKHTLRAIRNLYPEMGHIHGINPHAMRHLCASLYLAMNPKDYTGLATLLMDSLETVLREYAKNDHTGNSDKISSWGMSMMRNEK